MKKILIIHNNYQNTGGEDLAVINEVQLLKKEYIVDTLYFSNNVDRYLSTLFWLIFGVNLNSKNKLKKKIEEFQPDIAYVHNTWFRASIGIFDILNKQNIKTIVKLHNFRYFCTKSFLTRNHFKNESFCGACGFEKESSGFINKYFKESYLKSILILRYGKKYYRLLQKSKFKILVLTKFHKKFLINLGIEDKRIFVLPNFLDLDEVNEKISKITQRDDYIVYAGRISKEKGVETLIEAFLKSEIAYMKLKIIGDGPARLDLINKFQVNNLEFMGEISNSETLNIIKNAKAVVTSTKLFEGQPNLLCEASFLEVPSIFPSTGGIREFFPHEYNLCFKQFNYYDLIDKLSLIKNKKEMEKISDDNKKFISKILNEKKILNKFKIVINE
tara:strand:- start:8922 stop:10082 length:1161 start_codon:yes stop_codon:yes gene_type:complete